MTTIEIFEVKFHTNYGASHPPEWKRKWFTLPRGPIPPCLDP
jgi:hypothetical protein